MPTPPADGRQPAGHRRVLRLVKVSLLVPLLQAAPPLPAQADAGPRVSSLPAGDGAGPVVRIEGRFASTYRAYEVADRTTFDLAGYLAVSQPSHPAQLKFVAGDQPAPPRDLRVTGGVFHGAIPSGWDWQMSHAFGGAAIQTVGSGQHIVEHARIHNVQDGWRPRETPSFLRRAYPNNGRFLMRHCYVTGIRDDVLENDEFMPGAVEDCLVDGAYVFYSEQNERVNGVRVEQPPTIGPDEDPEVRLTRVLVRLAPTSGGTAEVGAWFKLHGFQARQHRLVATDCVFATDRMPRAGWRRLAFPADITFHGTNLLLWLGEPGTYGAPVPAGLVFLEGEVARDKWRELRNDWLVRHGYEPRGPDDWDPMQAPVAAPARAN